MSIPKLAAAAAATVVILGGVSACSGSDSEGAGGDNGGAENQAAALVEEGALPATIEHKFGETTVEEAPARVVTLGYTDQDAVLALGVTPVAVRYWDGMAPEGQAAGDWAADKITGDQPESYDAEDIEPEKIAAMRPDLIIATYSGIDQSTYDELSKIAPVIAQEGEYEDYQQPWDVTTGQIGAALGQPEKADELVNGVKDKMSALADKHSEWAGKTATIATYDGDRLTAFASKDPRQQFFTALGFAATPEPDAAAGDKFYGEFSKEEARKINADVVVWDQLSYAPEGRATVENEPAFANLPAMENGNALYLEDELEKAFGWQTVLSLDYVVDNIEEPLSAAVEGK